MSGYFSRLIQQTGIPLATGKVSDAGNLQEAIAPQIGSEFVPIQIEENQEIGNQEAQEEEFQLRYSTIVKNGQDARSTKSEFLGGVGREPAIVEAQFLTSQADENPLSQVEIESSSPSLEAQKTIAQEQEVESLSVQFTSFQNAIAEEKSPILPKFDNRENSDRTLENRRNYAVSETAGAVPLSPKKLPEPALSKHLQQSDFPEGSPTANRPLPDRQTIEILKEPNLPPTRQVNLQTVLEWVAETPAENPNYQLPIPNFQTQKTPNFVLSIGTISLTVEAPQSEVKKTPLPPMKSQQEVKPISQTSRLSRHYIR
jgi:hypothetical protein